MEPKEISDWQHEEFYRYISESYDRPRYTLHYRADAPLNIRSIFYVPENVRSSGPLQICLKWRFTAEPSLKTSPARLHFRLSLVFKQQRSRDEILSLNWIILSGRE